MIVLALVILGIGGLAGSAAANPLKPPAPPPVHQPFQIGNTYVTGNPAIKPSAPQNTSNTSGPAFTRDDVVAYFQKYGFLPLAPGARLQILTIQFVPASQASQLMDGEIVGRPDTYLVCYVKVQGPFLTASLHGNPAAPNRPKTARYGYEVFDAHTGNSLLWGVLF